MKLVTPYPAREVAKGLNVGLAKPALRQLNVAPRLPEPPRVWPPIVIEAVNLLAKTRSPEDKGLGDTVARHFGGTGVAFKTWFKVVFKKSCGCAERQAWLNQQFPYPLPWEKET